MDQNQKNLIEPISVADSKRYHEKLTVGRVRLPDPFYQVDADAWCSDLSELPFVTFPDMYVYFVLRKGLYTCQEMKAYRSLQAFLYFESGHVQSADQKGGCWAEESCVLEVKSTPQPEGWSED